MIRERLDRLVDRAFPGMGIRPVYLTAIATWLMVLFWYMAKPKRMPGWFGDAVETWLLIDDAQFVAKLWSHLLCVLLLAVAPTILTWLTDRMTLSELGLGIRHAGREFVIVAVLFVVFVPVIYYLSTTVAFQRTYPRMAIARTDAYLFMLYHLFYLVKWAAWEYFFRGWMLFAFKRDFGTRSVLISTIPFTLMHYGKPDLETMSALIAGFILCWLALRGRSIWPGVAIHAAVSTTIELFGTRWFWELFQTPPA